MIIIKEIPALDATAPEKCKTLLAHEELHALKYLNWQEQFPYHPSVTFQIAHNGKELFIRFIVEEETAAARITDNNSKVCTDSCVEFFLSLDDTGYYNFEFSCIGVMMLGFRKSRPYAEYATEDIISNIRRYPSLGKQNFEETEMSQPWELLVAIPASALFKHQTDTWKGLIAKGNFYKCGDKLSKPHYITFAPVVTEKPDFHRPEFFVELKMESSDILSAH